MGKIKIIPEMDGVNSKYDINVLKVTELYTYKWLKWSVLCDIYFTTINLKIGRKKPTTSLFPIHTQNLVITQSAFQEFCGNTVYI